MQHCLCQAYSCETQLVTLNAFIQELTGPAAHSGQWDIVVMDFAFDKVPYQHLLGKLHHYGIQGTTHDLGF